MRHLFFSLLAALVIVPAATTAQAERLYKLAAGQGWTAAQYYLARYYETGRGGVPRNHKKATWLFKLAASEGFRPS